MVYIASFCRNYNGILRSFSIDESTLVSINPLDVYPLSCLHALKILCKLFEFS